MRPTQPTWLVIFVVCLLGSTTSARAQSGETDTQAYATYYGDGMRDYAEGRNSAAIANFYRAYALRPSHLLLKLIVRTHDFMGHCSAAELQLDHFASQYPKKSAPRLQICRNPGLLDISCQGDIEEAVIDDTIRARCGSTISVPAGAHEVRSVSGGPKTLTVVESGQKATARVRASGASNDTVPLLEDDERYLVIRSPDGLYQLWVRTPLRDDPDMNRSPGPAGFTFQQGSDGLYHITTKQPSSEQPDAGASDE